MPSITIPQSALQSPLDLQDWLVGNFFTEILLGTHDVNKLKALAAGLERLARDTNLPTSLLVPLVKASAIRHAMQLDAGFIIALESATPPHDAAKCPTCEDKPSCPVYNDETFARSAPYSEELRVVRRGTGVTPAEVAQRILEIALQEADESNEEDSSSGPLTQ